jgi:uncharacterized membrane protein YtjA (UPF0391 family)
MLRAAIAFFIIGLVAWAIGAGNIGGISIDLGVLLLKVFIFLSVLSFIASYFMRSPPRAP